MNQVVLALGFGIAAAATLALGAVGFTLQFGITNVFNLAYGSIMTVGMFVAYVVNVKLHESVWLALLAGAIVGAIVTGLLTKSVFMPFMRRGASQATVIMVSLALLFVVDNVLLATAGSGSYAYERIDQTSLKVLGMVFTSAQLVVMAVSAGTMVALHLLLRRTRFGRAMRATAANIGLARSSGIPTDRITMVAWVLSGGFCGAAGVAFAINLASFGTTTGSTFLLVVIAAAVFGGVGQPYGAMLGALIIAIASELAALVSPDLKDVAAFGLLTLMLVLRPNGLVPAPTPPTEAVADQ